VPAVLTEVGLVAFPFSDVGAGFTETVELGIKFVRYHALVLCIEVTDDETIGKFEGVDGLGVVEFDADLDQQGAEIVLVPSDGHPASAGAQGSEASFHQSAAA